MFFDRENCSAIRVLHEISEFIESSIDKLLDLEQETLQILNKKSSSQPTTKPLESIRVKQEPIEQLSLNSLVSSSSQGLQNISQEINTTTRYYESLANTPKIRVMPEAFLKEKIYSEQKNNSFLVNKVTADKRKHGTSELNLSMENECPINKMIKKEPESSTWGNTLSSCPGCALANLNGNSVGKSVSSSCNNFDDFNKCKNTSKDINEQCSSACIENIQPLADTLNEINAMAVSELCSSVSADKCFEARIKFKKSFSASEVKELLTKVEVNGITDITVTKKYAVIAFCSRTNLKVLLAMNNNTDLRKIRAHCIEKVKKT